MEVNGGWHLKKELNISHLLTTLTLTVGVLVWAAKMDSRLTLVEAIQKQNVEINHSQDKELKEQQKQIYQSMREMDSKLNVLVQRVR